MKRTYDYLDAVRGLAAIVVVTRHTPDCWTYFFIRGQLAVDLFFLLSGFVIAHAYDAKLASSAMSVKDFIVVRWVRLYPMYAVSLVCAVAAAGLIPVGPDAASRPAGTIVWSALLAAFFLPTPGDVRSDLFPLNTAYWSLFWELLVNIVFAVAHRRLTFRTTTGTVLAAALTMTLVFAATGSSAGGFHWGALSLIGGFARATFGIFAGVWMHRYVDLPLAPRTQRVIPVLACCVMLLALVSPSVRGHDGVINLSIVLLVFPVGVWAATLSSPRIGTRVATWLGVVSYPIYVLHLPVKSMIDRAAPGLLHRHAPLSGWTLLGLLILLSMGLERYVDLPLRRFLMAKWLPRRAAYVGAPRTP